MADNAISLLSNGSATGSAVTVPAGGYEFVAEGTWNGATLTLQKKTANGTWLGFTPAMTFTADGRQYVAMGQGDVRAVISGGPPSAIYCYLLHCGGAVGQNSQSFTLSASDIEIGAVELKNSTTDTRANVLAASTAAAATDTPLVVALHPSSPLGAGSAAIGKLAANSGVDIGDVDILSIAAGDNNIGNVDVVTLPALVAGSAVVGSVGIDNTTIDDYETVAASQTAQALGATGATSDYIVGILVIPATTSPGLVTLLDNATSIPVFVGGASSVSNLVPFFIPIGAKSVSGAWKITTGANVSCIGVGKFT